MANPGENWLPVKVIEEFRALMRKRDRTVVSLGDARDATANFNATRAAFVFDTR